MIVVVAELRRGDANSFVHGHGWSAVGLGWLVLGGGLLLVAWAGTAFGLAISSLCRRAVAAQQWLACVLLAQILLTVQVAWNPDQFARRELTGAGELVDVAGQWTTVVLWGHDLLRIAGNPPGERDEWDLGVLVYGGGMILLLLSAALALAWAGLRLRRG